MFFFSRYAESKNFIFLKPSDAIGNRSEDILFALLKCRKDKKKLIFIRKKFGLFWKFKFRKANEELFNIRHDLIFRHPIIEFCNFILTLFLCFVRVIGIIYRAILSKFFGIKKEIFLVRLSDFAVGIENLWGDSTKHFSDNSYEYNYEEKLNIKFCDKDILIIRFPELKDANYVCLHVRSGGFLKDDLVNGKSNPRNSSIEHYFMMIDELVKRGFIVVRLGDKSMPKIDRKGVIDYAHSSRNSEFNDLALIEHCEFYIGSGSGPIDTALLFEKKIVAVNLISLSHCFWYRQGSIFIPKHFIFRDEEISLKQIMDNGFFDLLGTGTSHKEVIFEENTANEIAQTVIEFLEDRPLDQSQIKFNNNLYIAVRNNFLDHDYYLDFTTENRQKSKWLPRLKAPNGSIASFYLKRFFE